MDHFLSPVASMFWVFNSVPLASNIRILYSYLQFVSIRDANTSRASLGVMDVTLIVDVMMLPLDNSLALLGIVDINFSCYITIAQDGKKNTTGFFFLNVHCFSYF